MIASLKTHPSFETLFLIAQDFVPLSRLTKFQIGVDLGVIDEYDMEYTDLQIEEIVFSEAVRKGMLAELVNAIYRTHN